MRFTPRSPSHSDSEYCPLFGTDGIRGRVGQYPITPEACLQIAWVAGSVVRKNGGRNVLIGKDTRVSGYMLESVLEAGFIASGLDVSLLGVMPTPAVAFLTKSMKADLGVAISASHNPFQDNGFKFFDYAGMKLSDETESHIEKLMQSQLETENADALGKATRPGYASRRYVDFCKQSVNGTLDVKGLRIVLDCAHGATYAIAPVVFSELGAEVLSIGASPDGRNINLECGTTDTRGLIKEVVERRADLGIAFDGDGDRIAMVDASGRLLDGDHILYCLAKAGQRANRDFGGVVGTVMTNNGLEIALKKLGVPFVRADVGDRHVQSKMTELGWRLGGESSGHIMCHENTTTGDGIISALQVLASCQANDWSLSDIVEDLTLHPQVLVNVDVDNSSKVAVCEAIDGAIAAINPAIRDRLRIVIRPSGTEPVVRVMVEGEDPQLVDEIAYQCAHAIGDPR
ncbi:MAG: phosphoglucosamine mutase [Gammaproteobacteria bacterium]|nr:phosphoglucosamine mutase [Gammaproteobacteria bacterium]